MRSRETETEPENVLYRIKRGLAGYVSYLAACEMNEAFSEYVLYEPMLRILTARGFVVSCEFSCTWLPKAATGDWKKIDFEVNGHDLHFAMEAKWAQQPVLDTRNDYEKLITFRREFPMSRSFLCAFGRMSHIENIRLRNGTFVERGEPMYADFGITRYGCRIYEAQNTSP